MSGDESAEAWFAGLPPYAFRLRTCRLCDSSSTFRLLKENGVISLDSGLMHDFVAWETLFSTSIIARKVLEIEV